MGSPWRTRSRKTLDRLPRSHPWNPNYLRAGTVALLLPFLFGWPAPGYAGRDDAVVVKWLLELGQESRQKGKTREAMNYFQKVLLLQPSHPEALRSVRELTRAEAPPLPVQPAPPQGTEREGLPVPSEQVPATSPSVQEAPPSAPLGPDPAARDEAIEMAIARLMPVRASPGALMEQPKMVSRSALAVPMIGLESGFQPIRVVINGKSAEVLPPVEVQDGEMLVPCRLVAELLGYTVTPLDPDHVEVVSARGATWRLKLPGHDQSLTMPSGELERCLPVTVRFDAQHRTLQIRERKTLSKTFR